MYMYICVYNFVLQWCMIIGNVLQRFVLIIAMTTVILAMTLSVCVFIFYSEGPFECPLDSEKFQKQEVMNDHIKVFFYQH